MIKHMSAVKFIIIHLCLLCSLSAELKPHRFRNSTVLDETVPQETEAIGHETGSENNSVGGVNMISVMLQHTLYWRAVSNVSSYTVVYKKKHGGYRYRGWKKIPTCSKIRETFCDLSRNLQSVSLSYDVGVVAEPYNQTRVSSIVFCPEFNTTLLPPNFTAKRQGNIIFISTPRPLNKATGEPIVKQLATLQYQIQYWPKEEREKSIKIDVKVLHNTEITLQNISKGSDYCMTMRLFEKQYEASNHQSGSSNWTEVICINATSRINQTTLSPSNNSKTVLTILLLVIILIVVCTVPAIYKGWNMYKYVLKVGPLPEPLVKTIEEIELTTRDRNFRMPDYELDPHDAISTTDFSYLRIQPAQQYQAHLEPPTPLHEHAILLRKSIPDSKNKDLENFSLHLRRQRSRSRGYHSASSDSSSSSNGSEQWLNLFSYEGKVNRGDVAAEEIPYQQHELQYGMYNSNVFVHEAACNKEMTPRRDCKSQHFLFPLTTKRTFSSDTLSLQGVPGSLIKRQIPPLRTNFYVSSESNSFANFSYCSNVNNVIPNLLQKISTLQTEE